MHVEFEHANVEYVQKEFHKLDISKAVQVSDTY